MTKEFFKIEALRFVDKDDECYYLMEYHSRKGYKHSPENSLVLNFKKGIKAVNVQKYRQEAINKIARFLCEKFKNSNGFIFVPVPPSTSKTDPNYDNRLTMVLDIVSNQINVPYADVLYRASTPKPLHNSTITREIDHHIIQLEVTDPNVFQNKTIILFDDVITTGSTFKACKNILIKHFPNNKIKGLFIAKAIKFVVDPSKYFSVIE